MQVHSIRLCLKSRPACMRDYHESIRCPPKSLVRSVSILVSCCLVLLLFFSPLICTRAAAAAAATTTHHSFDRLFAH